MPDYSLKGKRYWLIGASTGIGAALAQELDRRGAHLILSARSEPKLFEVSKTLSSEAAVVPVDVTQQASVDEAKGAVGDVDGIIYMVGDYDPMSASEWDVDRALSLTDANFLGAMRVLPNILPRFQEKGQGHVVIIGSLAGFSGLAGAIGYGASKAALMHLAENLRIDLKGSGVRIQVVNPGFVKTRLTDKNDFTMPFIQTPEKAAKHIAGHMQSCRFSRSFPAGFAWYFKLRAIWGIVRA